MTAALPNMRVQRTRSSASPPRSPLTRGPLGGLRRVRPISLLVVSALLTTAAIATEATGAAQVESQILALEDKWRVAQHKNDVAAFKDLLSPDLTFIGTSGSLRNRSDYIASRSSSVLPRAKTYEYSELRVRVFGPVAIVTGREATTGPGVAFSGRFTHVWAENSGRWRLVAIQRTDIAPESPPQ